MGGLYDEAEVHRSFSTCCSYKSPQRVAVKIGCLLPKGIRVVVSQIAKVEVEFVR